MSLLIKALDKAQAKKAQAKDSASSRDDQESYSLKASTAQSTSTSDDKKISSDDLSLSPVNETLTTNMQIQNEVNDTPVALKGSAADLAQIEPHRDVNPSNGLSIESAVKSSRARAANVFTAKQPEQTSQTAKIAVIIALLAIALLAGFAYWYQFVFNQPDIVIPPRPSTLEMPQALSDVQISDTEGAALVDGLAELEVSNQAENFDVAKLSETNDATPTAIDKAQEKSVFDQNVNRPTAVKETLAPNEKVVSTAEAKETLIGETTTENATIEITKAKKESGINDVLMRAYTAYNLGNDDQAQTDYKLVLKQYGANVDAMLGLGAIAARQGRLADADGWYRKVLELEPRNEVAKSGMLSIQELGKPQVMESQIKSLLSSSPNDANLHATLGDLYASQGNWSAAQQAYFDAYRLNPTAENAFNLGVSLDQLAKSKIALPYYQEALRNADQSSLIDKAALEARISSIQKY
ncbi:MAG TPA: tetratricopeptide repeat protein [Methylophilaceae bacterium]|nr:tetratricopeptide repeat protein [Methylophilaceae bacterium]